MLKNWSWLICANMTVSGKIPGFMSSLANLTFPEVKVERGRRRVGAIRWYHCCQQTAPWFSVQTISVHFVLWIQQHSSAYFFIWCQVSPYNHLNYLHDDNNRLHVEESQSGAHPGLLRPLQLGGGVRIIVIITTTKGDSLIHGGKVGNSVSTLPNPISFALRISKQFLFLL